MLTEMSNVMSAVELSTKKEKTRKILEDNLKNFDKIILTMGFPQSIKYSYVCHQ